MPKSPIKIPVTKLIERSASILSAVGNANDFIMTVIGGVPRAQPRHLDNWFIIDQSSVAATVTGTINETTVATITIPAGTLGKNGKIRITENWSFQNSAATKTLRTKWANTLIHNTTHTTTSGVQIEVLISNRNSANSQTAMYNSSSAAPVSATRFTDNSPQTITITSQNTSAGNTCSLQSYMVEVLRRN